MQLVENIKVENAVLFLNNFMLIPTVVSGLCCKFWLMQMENSSISKLNITRKRTYQMLRILFNVPRCLLLIPSIQGHTHSIQMPRDIVVLKRLYSIIDFQ